MSCGGARGQPVLWGGQGSARLVGVWGQPILWGGPGVSPSCGEVRDQPVLWGPRVSVGLGTGKGFPAPHVWPPRLRSARWRPLGGPSSSPAFHLGTLMADSSPQDTFLQLLVSECPSTHACPRGVWKGGPRVLSLPHFNQGFQQVSVFLTFHCLRNNTSEHSGKVQTIIIRRQQRCGFSPRPPAPLHFPECGAANGFTCGFTSNCLTHTCHLFTLMGCSIKCILQLPSFPRILFFTRYILYL